MKTGNYTYTIICSYTFVTGTWNTHVKMLLRVKADDDEKIERRADKA